MINLLPATCTPDGQAQFILNDLTADSYIGGQGYYGNAALGTTEAVAGTDVFKNGARYTQTGRLRLYDATSALPVGAVWQGGMPFSSDGQLCIDTGTVTSPTYINGKAVGAKGLYAFAYTEFVATPTNLLPAGWTLTRAAPANGTSFDSTGTLVTAAIDAARGTYRYNGSAWVFDGTIVEAAAATNSLLRSRALGTAPWVGTGTAGAQNATGIDGAANTAWTLTDASAVAFDGFYTCGAITITANTSPTAVSVFVLKDSNNTTFPALRVSDAGSIIFATDLVFNTSTGAFTAQNILGAGGGNVEDYGLWWKVTCYSNNNGTAVGAICTFFPAYTTGTTASGANVAAQRSCVVGQFDHRPNSTVTDSPIITAGVAVPRAADVLTAPTAGLLVNGQGFAAIGGRIIAQTSVADRSYLSTFDGATGGAAIYQDTVGMAVYDVTAVRYFNSTPIATAPLAGDVFSIATTWAGSSCNGAYNGSIGTPQTFDGSMNFGATLQIGSNTAGAAGKVSMVLQSLRLGLTAASSAQLTTFTT